MAEPIEVAVILGSLRKESLNRKLVLALEKLALPRMKLTILRIDDLPLYNEDLWADPPDSVLRLKEEVNMRDAVLFVSPEYNRSVTPALKNAIDWGSRPFRQGVWEGKPAAIIGASPGALGTSIVQAHLRNVLAVIGMILMGQPEVHLSIKTDSITDDYTFVDESLCGFMRDFLSKFEAWIAAHAA